MVRLTRPLPGGAAALALLTGCAGASVASGRTGDADALLMALDDEYKAEATYAAVIDKFGEIHPFTNIIEAERRHAQRAKAEMDRFAISYDAANPYLDKLTAPQSVLAACKQGVAAEIENIALYDRILPMVEDQSVLATLTDLQWASRERHLPAFERCVARGGKRGRGRGRGQGRGRQ